MSSYVTKKTQGDTAWFTRDRFGMFIHFGLYSMAARHEWFKTNEKVPETKYDVYFDLFDPDLFDAKEWARRAKAAGMKYAVLTAKHHEGFCLFDSRYTDYKSTNTPFGRDIVKEYAEAFRAEGLRVGLYYSLIDWHHPQFPIDHLHPRRDDADAKEQNEKRDMRVYAQYMRDQVRELLTNYGKIDILWFDFSYSHTPGGVPDYLRGKGKDDWEAEKLIETARSIQPDIVIDNRTEIDQDIWTPEQYQPEDWVRHPETGELVVWETCQTFSGSWGYYRDEMTWKSPEILIRLLVDTVSKGGNLLMNVGPTGRGNFDKRAENALRVYEEWMRLNSRSIYACTKAEPEFVTPRDCRLTQSADGKKLYVHLFSYPSFPFFVMQGIADKVRYAQFLHDGSELLFTAGKCPWFDVGLNDLVLSLPPVKPDVVVPVIELFLK